MEKLIGKIIQYPVRKILAWIFLALWVFISYKPMLRGGFLWDDIDHIETYSENFKELWIPAKTPQYYPLTYSLFYFENKYLWHNRTEGYHWVNLILQIVNASLLWWLLTLLAIPGAWFAAMLFAIHPVNVESVAWISERKNVLSGFFYLSALIVYMKFALSEGQRMWRKWWFAFGLFICAVLSKTVTTVFSIVVLIILWWRKKKIELKDVYPLIPFFIVGLMMGLLTAHIEKEHSGAKGAMWDLQPVERILVAGRAIVFYFRKILWPRVLIFNYPRWLINPLDYVSFIYPVAVVVVLILLIIALPKTGKGLLALALIYLINLFPALGFFNMYPMRYSFVADHFQYFAGIAPLVLIAVGFYKMKKDYRRIMVLSVLMLLSALTWKRSHVYLTSRSLWVDTIKQNPDSFLARNNLSKEIFESSQSDEDATEAVDQYFEALKIFRDHFKRFEL